jgi:hypothetical protein
MQRFRSYSAAIPRRFRGDPAVIPQRLRSDSAAMQSDSQRSCGDSAAISHLFRSNHAAILHRFPRMFCFALIFLLFYASLCSPLHSTPHLSLRSFVVFYGLHFATLFRFFPLYDLFSILLFDLLYSAFSTSFPHLHMFTQLDTYLHTVAHDQELRGPGYRSAYPRSEPFPLLPQQLPVQQV